MNGLRSRAYSTALSNGKPLEWKDMRQSHIGHLSTGSYGQINKRDISCMHILQMSLLPVSKNIFKDVSSNFYYMYRSPCAWLYDWKMLRNWCLITILSQIWCNSNQ